MKDFEDLLYGALEIRQPEAKDGLRVNIDTILLAHFAKGKQSEKILELGCAHGAISLILSKRGLDVTGIDIEAKLIELAKENATHNKLNAKFLTADLRNYKQLWQAQSFDRIVVNPPYFKAETSSSVSPSSALAKALQGTECTIEDVVECAHYLLKNRGKLDLIMTATRSAELFCLLEKNNLPVKTVQFVHPKPTSEASVVLIEAVRAAKQGTKILSPLFVLDEEGKETKQMLENYKI